MAKKTITIKYNRIKAALAEADMKSATLATFMGVRLATVSDWCTNKNQPSIQDLYKIARFLNLAHAGELLLPLKKTASTKQPFRSLDKVQATKERRPLRDAKSEEENA